MKASTPDKSRFFSWKMFVVLWAAFLGGMILVGASQFRVMGPDGYGRSVSVRADLTMLTSALRLYAMNTGSLPTAEQGLAALVDLPVLEPVPESWVPESWVPESWVPQMRDFDALKDRWGNEYVYSLGPDGKDFQLHCAGPDGLDQTEDDITLSKM